MAFPSCCRCPQHRRRRRGKHKRVVSLKLGIGQRNGAEFDRAHGACSSATMRGSPALNSPSAGSLNADDVESRLVYVARSLRTNTRVSTRDERRDETSEELGREGRSGRGRERTSGDTNEHKTEEEAVKDTHRRHSHERARSSCAICLDLLAPQVRPSGGHCRRRCACLHLRAARCGGGWGMRSWLVSGVVTEAEKTRGMGMGTGMESESGNGDEGENGKWERRREGGGCMNELRQAKGRRRGLTSTPNPCPCPCPPRPHPPHPRSLSPSASVLASRVRVSLLSHWRSRRRWRSR